MTKQEHVARHKKLHEALDELVADMIDHNRCSLSKTPIMELLKWSHLQCDENTIEHKDEKE